MKLAVLVGDGHTVVVPPFQGPYQFHRYPVDFYLFEDGLFIRSADPSYRGLVGQRVVQLGSVRADDLSSLIAQVFPHDNDIGVKWGLTLALPLAEVLHALKIAEAPDSVRIVLEDSNNQRATRYLTDPIPVTGDMLTQMLLVDDQPDWITMRLDDPEPAGWLRNLETPYWYEYLEEEKLLHFHFNQVRNGDQPFEAFVEELFTFIDTHDVEALVVDLRNNEGGNLTMLTPLITKLIGNHNINTKGRLFVVTGRRTFSAAGYLAARLETYTEALFVGEPPGASPNFIGESSDPFPLPNSGIWVNPSTLYWQGTFAFDDRLRIEPDIAAPLTSEHYRRNHDPALAAIIERIRTE